LSDGPIPKAGERRGGLLPPAAIEQMVPGGDDGMPDDLTDDQIALLCGIGEGARSRLTEDKKRDLDRLIAGGYVEPTESNPSSAFKLTAKGVEFLGKRGAGLNEA